MSDAPQKTSKAVKKVEDIGRTTVNGVGQIGYCGSLIAETFYWLVMGPARHQTVRADAIFAQMMETGIRAIPIVAVLSFTIGVTFAIQGIHTLKIFGAESQVTFGVAFSIVREFGPLITGILVAGRSGSALAARIGIMKINQEIDSLTVMGINPVRYLVAPAMVAMLIMVPCLTLFANFMGLLGAGIFVALELKTSLNAFVHDVLAILSVSDLLHGLFKSVLFAILITVIGVANGASVEGGAEGVGKVTTRSVVQAITAIVLTSMLFVFIVTRG